MSRTDVRYSAQVQLETKLAACRALYALLASTTNKAALCQASVLSSLAAACKLDLNSGGQAGNSRQSQAVRAKLWEAALLAVARLCGLPQNRPLLSSLDHTLALGLVGSMEEYVGAAGGEGRSKNAVGSALHTLWSALGG